jgi:hypothetical protein
LSRDLHVVQLDVHPLCPRVRVLSLVVDVLLPVVDDLSPNGRQIFNRKEFFLIKSQNYLNNIFFSQNIFIQ